MVRSPSCMSGVLHFLHFHNPLFAASGGGGRGGDVERMTSPSSSSSPARCLVKTSDQLKGTEATRKSIKRTEEAGSSSRQEVNDIALSSSRSTEVGKKTQMFLEAEWRSSESTPRTMPTVVARLMGLEVLPEQSTSPAFCSARSTPAFMSPPSPEVVVSCQHRSQRRKTKNNNKKGEREEDRIGVLAPPQHFQIRSYNVEPLKALVSSKSKARPFGPEMKAFKENGPPKLSNPSTPSSSPTRSKKGFLEEMRESKPSPLRPLKPTFCSLSHQSPPSRNNEGTNTRRLMEPNSKCKKTNGYDRIAVKIATQVGPSMVHIQPPSPPPRPEVESKKLGLKSEESCHGHRSRTIRWRSHPSDSISGRRLLRLTTVEEEAAKVVARLEGEILDALVGEAAAEFGLRRTRGAA